MTPVDIKRRVKLLAGWDWADTVFLSLITVCTIVFVVSVIIGTLQYAGVIS